MEEKLTIEIPKSDFAQLEVAADELLAALRRIAADEPERERASEEHNRRFRQGMERIRATMERITNQHEPERGMNVEKCL